MICDLPAKLASDRSAAPRYEDYSVINVSYDLIKIYLDALTGKKILDLYLSDLLDIDLSVYKLIDSGESLKCASRFLADAEYLLFSLG